MPRSHPRRNQPRVSNPKRPRPHLHLRHSLRQLLRRSLGSLRPSSNTEPYLTAIEWVFRRLRAVGRIPGGGGVAGGAGVGPVVGCNAGWGGGSPAGNPEDAGAPTVICERGVADCDDGHTYRIDCGTTTTSSVCTCFVDEFSTKSFGTANECPAVGVVNSGCGWNLTQI
jgi:hypothetical protein